MAKSKKADRLFEIFAGEYINIIINVMMEQTVTDGEQLQTVKTPISVQGYLTEEDDVYLYLGHTPGLLNQSVAKNIIVHVEVAQEETEVEETMEVGELPKRSEEYN